jgi:hypothetical protein
MKLSQLMTRVSLAVALAGGLAVTLPSVSYAAFGEHQYYNSDEEPGSAFSYYKGYFSNDSEQAGQATRPQAQERTNSRAPRRNATEPTQAPSKPSCLVDAYGACR